jgi:DNA-binding NarL/FixJ family response regulator
MQDYINNRSKEKIIKAKFSKILYFCPTYDNKNNLELDSISKVKSILEENSDLIINIIPNWNSLIENLNFDDDVKKLIVFRLDYLQRKNMLLDEVLEMLQSLTKFISSEAKIDLAVVVWQPINSELIEKLKRNRVLGIIPAVRFWDKKHSIEAYQTLRQSIPYWPSVAILPELVRYKSKKKEVKLTDREKEIFNLVARRGLSNKKVSQMLSIKENTVKQHVGSIFKKYGVRNRTQLALCNNTGTIILSH